ncbi:MAG: hypothetical protein HY267_07195 [Deltaproteobacteria bacterium]|nr:hypothetical protein [Deltaproteobacteria bacterium]
MSPQEWPLCQCCKKGVLLPLSDYGPQGNDIPFKLWVCHNPACGFSLRIDKGQVSIGGPVRVKPEGWASRRQ